MEFEEILTTILSQGIPASTVLRAIHDGLVEVNKSSANNIRSIKELEELMVIVRKAQGEDTSSPEVVLSRGGRANLKARLDEFEARLARIDTEIELKRPYRETKTKTVVVPFKVETRQDSSVYTTDSYTQQKGVDGSKTITYEEEYINGESTGRIFNEQITSEKAPVNEIRIVGTKVLNPKSIRYIRFSNVIEDPREGRWAEIEVYADGRNIASSATIKANKNSSIINRERLFDGNKGSLSTIVKGDRTPWLELDFGTARKDLTEIKFSLPAGITFNYLVIDISPDGFNYSRVYDGGRTLAKAEDYVIPPSELHGPAKSTYTDFANQNQVAIGGNIRITASPIRLYWDSDRALSRNTYQSGLWYNRGTHKVVNKRTVNGVTVYGLDIGWIREDDNR
ncbi:G5 domain-containing protein [Aerococcaceae bacterium DSM 111020]|nr:G5 domain-containing protein [Aerococcaceae bacterium DSM 111020]